MVPCGLKSVGKTELTLKLLPKAPMKFCVFECIGTTQEHSKKENAVFTIVYDVVYANYVIVSFECALSYYV